MIAVMLLVAIALAIVVLAALLFLFAQQVEAAVRDLDDNGGDE